MYLCICISMYLSIYLDSPTTLYFWGLSRKKTCFSESTCLEIKYCFLHVGDGHSWRWAEAAEIKKCATLPTWNSLLQVLFWFWMIESAGEKISKALVLVYVWCHGFDLPCFDSWARFALSFCTHEGRSQHSVADMRVHCSILVTNIPGKICPDNANMQSLCKGLFSFKFQTYFFCAEGRPDGVRKYGKKRPKYGNIRPVWTRPNQRTFFLKTYLFFTVRPSICQNCVSSWHHKVRASGCAQSPCVFFRSVAMYKCLPPQLIVKSGQRFHISTEIEDPKLFCQEVSVIRVIRLGLRWCVRCLIQHQAGQAQSVHMIWFSNA